MCMGLIQQRTDSCKYCHLKVKAQYQQYYLLNKFKLKAMMEPDIRISKPFFSKSSPLSCFLCDTPPTLPLVESRLTRLFERSKALKTRYGTLQELWNHLLAVRPSHCGNYLAAVTEDFYLVVFDLYKEQAYMLQVPIMEGMLLCTIAVCSHAAIIGGVHQVLVVHFDNDIITGVDFSTPSSIKSLTVPTKPERQRKLAATWKNFTKTPKTDYSGDFHEIVTSTGVAIKGFIGVLYTKEQFAAATKKTRDNEEDEEDKAQLDSEAARYVLQLTKVSFAENENALVTQKTMSVEYSVNPCTQPLREAYLIVRTDSKCEMAIAALNSSHKYYCQLLLLATNSTTCMHLRPISFISSSDILPTDKYGRTSMLISDIVWTPNDQFMVVLFCANYYCVLSRLGQPLNLLCNNSLVHFSVLTPERPGEKIEDGVYPNLRASNKAIFLFGDTGSAVIEYESKLPLLELWRLDQTPGKVNKIFRLILSFPELGVNAAALEKLEKALDNEVVYFSPQKRSSYESSKQNQMEQNPDFIQFKNPFPLEPTADIAQIVNGGLLLIEATRWSANISNNLLELVQDELENLCRLLYLKNEPMYFLHIMQMYKKFAQKQVSAFLMENVRLYGISSTCKSVIESQGIAFNFDKKKALLMFYCLIQFRNFKATSFNILYLVTAGLLKNKWGKHKVLSEVTNSIMSILKSNLPSEKGKKQDFFETEIRTSLNDKGALYQSMFELCEKAFPESGQPPEDVSHGQIDPSAGDADADTHREGLEKPKPLVSLMDALVGFYEPEKMGKLFEIINQMRKADSMLEKEFVKEDHLRYLYICVDLIKKGKFNTALKTIQDLLNIVIAPEALLRPENKVERPLVLIITFTCLLLTALSVLNHNCTINFCEVPTFLYKILYEQDPLNTFNQLKIPVLSSEPENGMLHMLVSNCPNKQREVYSAIGILLQISAHKTAIEILLSYSEPLYVLLGLMVLNNQLNKSMAGGKEQSAKEYLDMLVVSVKKLLGQYPIELARNKVNTLVLRNLFSTCMELGSRPTGIVISYLALPSLVSHLYALLHTAAVAPEQMVQSTFKPATTPVQPCPFLAKLAKTLCGCSIAACQRVFAGFFLDSTRATVFNNLLQESVQILAVSLKLKIVEFSSAGSAKAELVKVAKFVPPKVAEGIKVSLTKLMQLIWEVSLLFSIEGFKDGTVSSANKLRLAGYMLRYSARGADEQQELQFIQQGLSLLKTVNYSELKIPADSEAIQDLGNALEIYAEKWEPIIKNEKASILALAKGVNVGVYKMLGNYMARRKPAVRPHIFPKGVQSFDSDIVFGRLFEYLKQMLNWTLQKDSPLAGSIERGEEVRSNLRKTLEGIDALTGIPKTMMLERENSKWTLKPIPIFHKANDVFSEESKVFSVLEEVLERVKPIEKEYVTEDTDKYHYAVAGNAIGTWRIGSETEYTSALQVVRNKTAGIVNSIALSSLKNSYALPKASGAQDSLRFTIR
eukprot:TRINITY_DN1226_c0_g1_i1.p1 TRINITY_DN1226_c0_g1~~TRINITY_DN1226_c0_g1_i1.p1  ORF type:complete len:1480 (-),score=135.50 TRINITY_DN1226_c0_g1_i1:5166-9605(-)